MLTIRRLKATRSKMLSFSCTKCDRICKKGSYTRNCKY